MIGFQPLGGLDLQASFFLRKNNLIDKNLGPS